jgi:Ca2+-binding EF-hand superfamily protein
LVILDSKYFLGIKTLIEMDASKKAQVKDLFKSLDKDGNGFIDFDELKEAAPKIFKDAKVNYSDDQIHKMLESVDSNADGKLNLEEFMKLL